jgi:hypothetical protein
LQFKLEIKHWVPHRFPHMANGAPDDLGTSKLTSSKPGHRSEELVDEFSGIDDKFSGIDDKFSGIDTVPV